MELFLDDGKRGLSDDTQPSMTHDFVMAITAVVIIVILALVLVQCINK